MTELPKYDIGTEISFVTAAGLIRFRITERYEFEDRYVYGCRAIDNESITDSFIIWKKEI